MLLPKLFSKSSDGSLEEWVIEVLGDSHRTHHGQVGGKITTTEWFKIEGKNTGRKNETSGEEQALLCAQRKWDKKVEHGATQDPSLAGTTILYPLAMTAKTYSGVYSDLEASTVLCQPKLDGMRALVSKEWDAISRGGKKWPTVPHILEALTEVWKEYPDLVLDGELYNHAYYDDFDELSSVIKRKKPSASDLAKSERMTQYHIYDLQIPSRPNLTYVERADILTKIFSYYLEGMVSSEGNPYFVLVATASAHNESELEKNYERFLEDGYEGMMIRIPHGPYEPDYRSSYLLKHKPYIDSEFQIVDVIEGKGNRKGMAQKLICITESGEKFPATLKGKQAFRIETWENRATIFGKWATVRYQNLTPKGNPRFPRSFRLREGKSID